MTAFIARDCIYCGEKIKTEPALMSLFLAKRMFGWEQIEIQSGRYDDYREGTAYPLCKTCGCPQCGGLFMDIRPDAQSSEAYYKGYQSELFFDERELVEPSFANRRRLMTEDDFAGKCSYLPEIENFILKIAERPPNVILDWGGGNGSGAPFLGTAQHIAVADLNEDAVENLVASVHRYDGSINDSIDLISCRHVLEHVAYPVEVLQVLHKICNKKTLLYLEVPLENLMRTQNPAIPKAKIWTEHINFFTEKALKRAAERAGFRVVAMDTFTTGRRMAAREHDFKVLRMIGAPEFS